MISDERGLPLSTDSAEAASLFDRAVGHYLKFHADMPALIGQMLAADPHFVLGHCFKGYLLLSASNPVFGAEIAATLTAAQVGAATATERERQHVAAFRAWAGGALGAGGVAGLLMSKGPDRAEQVVARQFGRPARRQAVGLLQDLRGLAVPEPAGVADAHRQQIGRVGIEELAPDPE